jgi:hypothetical protein
MKPGAARGSNPTQLSTPSDGQGLAEGRRCVIQLKCTESARFGPNTHKLCTQLLQSHNSGGSEVKFRAKVSPHNKMGALATPAIFSGRAAMTQAYPFDP